MKEYNGFKVGTVVKTTIEETDIPFGRVGVIVDFDNGREVMAIVRWDNGEEDALFLDEITPA